MSKRRHYGDPCDVVYVDLGDKHVMDIFVYGIPHSMCDHINVVDENIINVCLDSLFLNIIMFKCHSIVALNVLINFFSSPPSYWVHVHSIYW